MNEGEFRDWARRAQGDFNERLKAVETQVAALRAGPAREEIAGSLGEAFSEMAAELSTAVRGGGVRGLGVALVSEDGGTRLGFAASDGGYLRLAGAVQLLGHTIVDEKFRADGEKEMAAGAASGAAGQTDEGNPGSTTGARGSVDPAPADDRIAEGVSGGKG